MPHFRKFLLLFTLLASPALAQEAVFAEWRALRDPATPLVSFEEARLFLSQHPGWPQEKTIRLRAEQAALFEHPDPEAMRAFCANYPPISGRGMFACLAVGAGDTATRDQWMKRGWIQGDFSESEEDSILAIYENRLDARDYEARTDRLLYEGKVNQVKRMLPRLRPAYRLLAEARLALASDAKNANAKLYNVPKDLKSDPGLVFNRMQWRARNGQDDGVKELLLHGPSNPPYADLWWPYRAAAVREALEEKRYNDAMKILAKHGDLSPENNADALFLKGWVEMEFLGNPREGYKDFYKLYGDVQTPVSKSRAAYWAGRAAKENGNPDIARGWFEKGAEFPTVFYGQLAAAELKNGSLDLPSNPIVSAVPDETLAKTAMWLVGQGDLETANLFLTHATDQAGDASQAEALAQRAIDNNYRHGGVKVAKQALRKNFVLVEAGWPLVAVPSQSAIEPALALSIARQESEFNPAARSRADARGLMQVLPGTANHTAKRFDLSYDAGDLYDPAANMVIGTTYLGALINGFDGNYVLAIASYNAGPANVRKWIARFGAPPKDVAGMINWIEKIPFAETRNYVQRVMENLQVYRARLDSDAPLAINRDLER
jgi:soluble lytic murein transglycosylase